MSSRPDATEENAEATRLTEAERQWLHDKYERLAAEESALAANRTTYYAAVGTVLITGLVVSLNYFANERFVLLAVAAGFAGLGLLISSVWAVLLHRTNDAQAMWREAARQLEQTQPPLEGQLPGAITLRTQERLPVNLLRPYEMHDARFARGASWMDRLNPSRLTEILPLAFLLLWSAVLAGTVVWFLR